MRELPHNNGILDHETFVYAYDKPLKLGVKMPALGLIAIGRFFIRIASLLWRKREIRGLLVITFVTIFIGTWFYYQFEPTIITWVDAYYFTVITLTTIGYGDFSPTIPLTKLFTTIYVFIGLGIIAGLIGLVGEAVIQDANQRSEEKKPSKSIRKDD